MSETTRFAPSPSGHLHLGHAFSALFAHERAGGGGFLLRIEDIDSGRCRPEYEAALLEDLAWLGLVWEEPPRRQSDHLADYAAALERLNAAGLIYPCFCTRREIAREIARSASAPQGPDGLLYPGTCRALSQAERRARLAAGARPALRLDMPKAARAAGTLSWQDEVEGTIQAKPETFGDVVLARRDIGTSYHLAVTLDDALQGISLVTRGRDLFEATHVHRLLQALLDLPVPRWHHHALVTDEAGRRLAKRDDARSLRGLRAEGVTPGEVRARLKSA
jgi:glutamyl-Q tRNA(Asp) synthetase